MKKNHVINTSLSTTLNTRRISHKRKKQKTITTERKFHQKALCVSVKTFTSHERANFLSSSIRKKQTEDLLMWQKHQFYNLIIQYFYYYTIIKHPNQRSGMLLYIWVKSLLCVKKINVPLKYIGYFGNPSRLYFPFFSSHHFGHTNLELKLQNRWPNFFFRPLN